MSCEHNAIILYLIIYNIFIHTVCRMCIVKQQVHYKQIKCINNLTDSIRIQFQLTQMPYITKLISSPVKPPQLIFHTLTLIKSSNTSNLVHTLSDIRCQLFILDLVDNLPTLSNVSLSFLPVLDIGLHKSKWEIIFDNNCFDRTNSF